MKSSNDSKKAQLRHLLQPTLFLAGFLKEHGSQPGLLFSEGIYRLQAFFFFSHHLSCTSQEVTSCPKCRGTTRQCRTGNETAPSGIKLGMFQHRPVTLRLPEYGTVRHALTEVVAGFLFESNRVRHSARTQATSTVNGIWKFTQHSKYFITKILNEPLRPHNNTYQ